MNNFSFRIRLLIISLFLFTNISVAAPIEIRFAHVVPENTLQGQTAEYFKKLVEEQIGDDKVIINVYHKNSLPNSTSPDDLLEGNVEILLPPLSFLYKYSRRLQIFDLPFIFVTPEAANNFIQGPFGERLLSLMKPSGLTGLGYLNNGMKQLTSNVPIKVPQDAEGVKFRIMSAPILEDQFSQIGAIALKKPFFKLYELLKSKEVDGQENPWSNIYSSKFYEHQPYILESNHGYLGYMVLTSTKFWESIPSDELRKKLKELLAKAIRHGNSMAVRENEIDRAKIVATELSTIHVMTLAERQAWVIAMEPLWKRYESDIGAALIQAAASSR